MINSRNNNGIPQFADGATVCFLGDSLTSGALWTEMIFEHYLSVRPQSKIRVYDAGIGGGSARYALEHLDEDVMSFSPSDVVIMFGENDIKAGDGSMTERAARFEHDMIELSDELLRRGVNIYFMSEPDTALSRESDIKTRETAHAVLLGLAKRYGVGFCDIFELASHYLIEECGMTADDGIHLTERGQSLLGRVFLDSQGFDGYSDSDEGFYDVFVPTYDGDHRRIFNAKLRAIWLALRNISTGTGSVEERVRYVTQKLETRANGAWDEFCYYRAVDFIELFPNMRFYRDELERTTNKMIDAAMLSAEKEKS